MFMILNSMWVLVGSTASIGKFGFWLHEDSASYNFFFGAMAPPFYVSQMFVTSLFLSLLLGAYLMV